MNDTPRYSTIQKYGDLNVTVALPGVQHEDPGGLPLYFDYYGEVNPRFQILLHSEGVEETPVHVRYNDQGRIVEVAVDDPEIQVYRNWPTSTPWQVERDGE